MYAIIRAGGTQYRVEEGSTIEVNRLSASEGERIEIREVLLLSDGDSVTIGTPTVPDARVVAEVVAHGRAPKITVFRYKAKTRYRRKTGHRQDFTRLTIQRIQVGEEKEAPEKPAARRRGKAASAQTEAVSEKPATRRRGKAASAQTEAVSEKPAAKAPRKRAASKAKTTSEKKAPARRTRRKTDTKTGE